MKELKNSTGIWPKFLHDHRTTFHLINIDRSCTKTRYQEQELQPDEMSSMDPAIEGFCLCKSVNYIAKRFVITHATLLRHFCINCGTPLFILNPKLHNNVVVTTCSMDDPKHRPSLEFWKKCRRDWIEGLEKQTWEADES
jgi:Glutathione-dependent formaldehyde-activating enzyme